MKIHWTAIERIVDETPSIRTYFLQCPADFHWQEGARTHLGLPGFNTSDKPKQLVRHMSIASTPDEGVIAITTRLPQPGSVFKQALAQLAAGAPVALFKTASHLPLERSNQNIYLLSQGVGLATFRAHAVAYLRDSSRIRSLHSLTVASPGESLYADVFQSRSGQGFTARYVHQRKDFQAEARALAQDAGGLFYLVGSDDFLMQTVMLLRARGVDARQIRLDKRAHELPEFLGTTEQPAAEPKVLAQAAA